MSSRLAPMQQSAWYQCCCPLGKVLVLERPRGPIYNPCPCPRSLGPQVLVLVLGRQRLENCQWLRILQIVCYVWSREVHKFGYRHLAPVTVKNGLLISAILHCNPVLLSSRRRSSPCPQGPIYKSLSLSLSLSSDIKSLSSSIKSLSSNLQSLITTLHNIISS